MKNQCIGTILVWIRKVKVIYRVDDLLDGWRNQIARQVPQLEIIVLAPSGNTWPVFSNARPTAFAGEHPYQAVTYHEQSVMLLAGDPGST
jgi:hypothetical protein